MLLSQCMSIYVQIVFFKFRVEIFNRKYIIQTVTLFTQLKIMMYCDLINKNNNKPLRLN